jgi:hypothetical protein
MKGLTKRDSKGSLSKMLYLSPSAFHLIYKIYINKTHSLEVSKKRNAALTTNIIYVLFNDATTFSITTLSITT